MKKGSDRTPSGPTPGKIIFCTAPDGSPKVEVLYELETFWLTQKRMADLLGVDVRTINYHLKEIFGSGELLEATTIRKIRIVRQEGGRGVARELDTTASTP
jgi:hypothetical protein